MTFKSILKSFILWRLAIFLISFLAIFAIPLRSSFTDLTPGLSLPNFINMWANFDGHHYLDIARYGYNNVRTLYHEAFFPLYPLSISFLVLLIKDYVWSGLIISHLSLIAALYYLYKLVVIDESATVAKRTLFFLLIAPTSFFFVSIYTESLFLLLTVLSFYQARQKNWLFASTFALLASATRVTGVLLFPALLIEFYFSHSKNLKKSLHNPQILWLLLAPLGLIIYMNFLNAEFGDPLRFINVQAFFGGQRDTSRLILLHQVFYRYAKMFIFVDHTNPLFFTVFLEGLTGLVFLGLSLLTFKHTRPSYAFYAITTFVVPTLTGTFLSMPRFALALFPAFIVLAKLSPKIPKRFQKPLAIATIIIGIIATSLYTRGYFIA